MQVVSSPDHRRHDPQVEFEQSSAHAPFEHPGRAERIHDALAADPAFEIVAPTRHGPGPIEAVHDPGLVRFLGEAWAEYQQAIGPAREVVPDVFFHDRLRAGMAAGREPEHIGGRLGWWCYETTTPLVEGTFGAACGAVDVALTAAELVVAGAPVAYGLCRPPGHHASRSLYGGYCFFNNAAVVADSWTRRSGGRVAVLDVDYHHGNGTQQIFYERDDVLYVSLHGDPRRAYPYSVGFADETGHGRGAGLTRNLPLPERMGDDDYLRVLDDAMGTVARFGPEVLVVSLGLDTFVTDPICDLALTTKGFARCGAAVAELALPTVVLQEGGYDVEALGENVRRWLLGFTSGAGAAPAPPHRGDRSTPGASPAPPAG